MLFAKDSSAAGKGSSSLFCISGKGKGDAPSDLCPAVKGDRVTELQRCCSLVLAVLVTGVTHRMEAAAAPALI